MENNSNKKDQPNDQAFQQQNAKTGQTNKENEETQEVTGGIMQSNLKDEQAGVVEPKKKSSSEDTSCK